MLGFNPLSDKPLSDTSQQSSASTGELTATIGAITLSSAAQLRIAGSLNTTIGDITLSSTGGIVNTGQLNTTIGDITLSSTGQLRITGTFNQSIGAITLSSTGTASTPITGTLNATIGVVTLSSTGTRIAQTATGGFVRRKSSDDLIDKFLDADKEDKASLKAQEEALALEAMLARQASINRVIEAKNAIIQREALRKQLEADDENAIVLLAA